MARYAYWTGFGNPSVPELFSHFSIMLTNQSEYGDWQGELLTSTRQIATTSASETQILGWSPHDVVLTVEFASRADYYRFKAKTGTEQTLVLLAGFTSQEGVVRTIDGRDYEFFDNCLMLAPSDAVFDVDRKTTTCTATFRRGYDYNTRLAVR